MYAALGSRPDIAFSVTALSWDNVQPLEMHPMAAKRVLRYLKTTAGFEFITDGSRMLSLLSDTPIPTGQGISQLGNPSADAYSNSETSMSTTSLSYLGLIHWQAKSQSVVALSTLEAEYIACSPATWESLCLKRMMKEAAGGMAVKIVDGPVPIRRDNQDTMKLITSGVVRQKSKHIDLKYHHVHDEQIKGAVKFQYVTSESNPADLLTKPLAFPRHERLLQLTGLIPFSPDDGEPEYDE